MGRIYIDATSASSFHCPARRVVKWLGPRVPVYHYSFNYLADSNPSTRWTGLAQHSVELQSVFFGSGTREDAVMAAQLQNLIHRFLAHRDVNHADAAIDALYSPVYGNRTLVTWPTFNAAVAGGDRSMHFQSGQQHMEVMEGVHADQCDDLWDWTVPHPAITPRRLPPVQHVPYQRLRRSALREA